MSEFVEYEGYHGTFVKDIDNILQNGFHFENREDHWLGQGIYFYADYNLAKWFVSKKGERKGIDSNIAVIKVVLKTTKGKVLNLDTVDGVDLFYQKIYELWGEFRTVEFSQTDEHKNRCFILDVIKEILDLDIIIHTFTVDNPSYGKARTGWFHEKNFPLGIKYKETQICATNNHCIEILNVEYPEDKYQYPLKLWFEQYKRK